MSCCPTFLTCWVLEKISDRQLAIRGLEAVGRLSEASGGFFGQWLHELAAEQPAAILLPSHMNDFRQHHVGIFRLGVRKLNRQAGAGLEAVPNPEGLRRDLACLGVFARCASADAALSSSDPGWRPRNWHIVQVRAD